MIKILSILSFLILTTTSWCQSVWIHPNQGQWDNEIKYAIDLTMGKLYVDSKGFTYDLNNAMEHKHEHGDHSDEEHVIECQVIKSHFNLSSWNGESKNEIQSEFYRNYYLGNEPSKWKSNVRSYKQTTLVDFFEGIDLVLNGETDKLKYTFLVDPGKDPSVITYDITGSDKVALVNGQLHINSRFGEIIEEKPVAWTEFEGRKTPVDVEYVLNNNQVSFNFPKGYNENEILVIDPYLVFSSFTGASGDNWGMTATPDNQGNLYAGGILFGLTGGYPIVAGSFDATYNGGNNYTYVFGSATYNMTGFDVAISKFNALGTDLLFSTYLGGSGNEAPHSLVVDAANNLYVLGVTGSSDFPTIAGCFDVSFNGGPVVAENELGYNGADMYITRFNAAGSALVGSTFIGGSGTDGINIGNLNFNYGDPFRGEIIESNGFIYVSSTTQSSDFPTIGAAQGSLNGTQDAVVFKINNTLTTMSWSTYFGGSGLESGNSLQIASNGNIFVAGGTNSSNLPITIGNDLTYNGGIADGYLLKIQGSSSLFLAGTYMGLAEYDQAYFVQLDNVNEVYVYGQSESAWTISSGVYANPNSGQFIRKYSNNLNSIIWTTMIGAGSGHPEISPTAFLVSDCYDIYISGWGGTINSAYSNQAQFSSTIGFPTTPDGYQLTTNGSNFYIAVLDQDAASLKYGTFMGGSSSSYNHVDGGTSRFDKSGRIYHAVCGACGGQDFGFTSTPGVWSPTNNSTNCNLAAFKFELNTIEAIVSEPQTVICLPDPVVFNNNSANGNSFYWDFGDGTTSTDINPSHVYPGAGDYTVTLVVADSNGCFSPDSVTFEVHIGDFQGGVVQPTSAICPGDSYQLEAYGGATYSWTPATVLDDPTSPTPIATIYSTTDFTVIISDSCGADTIQVTLPVFIVNTSVSNDTSVCIGNNAYPIATGGGTYLWTPSTYLDNPNISNPVCTPDGSIEYHVEITTNDGCQVEDSVTVSVFFDPPIPIIPDTVEMCRGGSAIVNVGGADTYLWSPNYAISSLTSSTVTVSPEDDFTYYCDFFNACGSASDSVFIDVIRADIQAGNDTIICPGQSATIWATGGISYMWIPATGLSNPGVSQLTVSPNFTTLYIVFGTDATGCTDTASVLVELYPQPFIQTSPDVYAIYGDIIELTATSTTSGTYIWSPAEFLSCVSCSSPVTSPNQNMTYTVTYTDANGCSASDIVHIYYDPLIYVPNTFTPNADEHNQGFHVYGSNIKTFEMFIFDRWGELIFTMTDLNDYWDGTYDGLPCQDGTYVWKIRYFDFLDIPYELTGHVNLLR